MRELSLYVFKGFSPDEKGNFDISGVKMGMNECGFTGKTIYLACFP